MLVKKFRHLSKEFLVVAQSTRCHLAERGFFLHLAQQSQKCDGEFFIVGIQFTECLAHLLRHQIGIFRTRNVAQRVRGSDSARRRIVFDRSVERSYGGFEQMGELEKHLFVDLLLTPFEARQVTRIGSDRERNLFKFEFSFLAQRPNCRTDFHGTDCQHSLRLVQSV